MGDSNEFSKLVTKFLFLNCAEDECHRNSTEINLVLNDLNCVDYQTKNIIDLNAIFHLFDSLSTIPTSEETLIVKSCCLISMIINKQKIQLPSTVFKKVIHWLEKCLQLNFRPIALDTISTLKIIFKHHPYYCLEFWNKFLLPGGLLSNIFNDTITNKLPEDYDTSSDMEIFVATILCIQNLLTCSDDVDITDEHERILVSIGSKILDLLYSDKIQLNNDIQRTVFITSALNILHRIANERRDWTEDNLGKILGIAKAYIHYGLLDVVQVKPQKIVISQQPLLEPVLVPTNKGGKVLKTRKLKTLNKNRKVDKNKSLNLKMDSNNLLKMKLDIDLDVNIVSPSNRTSDSDFSGSENGNHSQKQMYREAKLRLVAISLIGLITKICNKKTLYGYWHTLFPLESSSHNSPGLLTCVLRDPSARNRTTALHTASILLFGSKAYLFQAENSGKAPKTFTPFSISLGNMILSIYEVLTQALSSESSLPVLTQVLKCLSVIIQNTPFHRLRSGFVTSFVKHIHQLIYHKDPTIQVASLIVMEFLISVQEITDEISECIGLSKYGLNTIQKNQNHLNDLGVNEVIEIELDEEMNSDCENYEDAEIKSTKYENNIKCNTKMSWLLEKVLENLGIIFDYSKKISKTATPVRIESLQVLSLMALHFMLIKDHLEPISCAIKMSLNDNQTEIRLYASKCLDVIGHSINKHLLENSINIENELTICQKFWINILPSTIEKIRDQNQCSILKAHLCDFLSNIGVHIFERLPQNVSVQIISLLTGIGCNEENTVRAAAVRALAMCIVFPSLREDLCFIENTAELTIQLLKDSNLCTRVKASWALGNISDAFIINSDSQFDKISDNLLKQMLEVVVDAASDNDKVRSNAVRTLGNLLRLISEQHLSSLTWRIICIKAIEKLSNCMNAAGNAKVKWNSCYAIGNLMKNKALFKSYGGVNGSVNDFDWQKTVFPSLCSLIVNSPNFKVRINGAAALTVLTEREQYGSYMNLIWTSLLSAIEQSNNLTDFNEYKHRDNLQEQLCLTLSHIIKIATMDDFLFLKSELVPKLEVIKEIWTRVINRILPETAASLLSCTIQLKTILSEGSNLLTSEQRTSVLIISSCLT